MKEIKVKMQIEFEGYYCSGTNIYTCKNEEHERNILYKEYFKVLQLRYSKLHINAFIGYEFNLRILEYTHEDFINDLIKYYFRTNDNEEGDLYFLILDKMESSKSFEEFISFIDGLKEGLEGSDLK